MVADLTVGALSRKIAIAVAIPQILAFIFDDMSGDAIHFFATSGLASVPLNIYKDREFMKNPQTLQYLYKIYTSGKISGTTLGSKPVYYQLDSYN